VTQLACLNPRCAIPRRHRDDCASDQCRGCLPGWAADGLRLCAVCARRLGENAVKAAELHGELELMLRPNGTGGQATGKPGSASPPREEIANMRREIRHILASWSQLIAEERGVHLPDGTEPARVVKAMSDTPIWRGQGTIEQAIAGPPSISVDQMAAFIRTHAEWLAAQEYAGEAADELASLVSRAWGLAYPSGTRRIEVGPCPRCDGTLTAIVRPVDSTKPTEVVCDGDEQHRWDSTQLRTLDRLVMARKRAA
jgi:hypothetical protein